MIPAALNVEIGFEKKVIEYPQFPVPDFDETGLIGRETDLNELENLIRGPWPIITIVGEELEKLLSSETSL